MPYIPRKTISKEFKVLMKEQIKFNAENLTHSSTSQVISYPP